LTVETADSNGPVFSLTSVYVPAKRNNLAAFFTVDAAAQREGYGTLRVLRLSSTSNIPGPSLIANQFRTDPKIQNELLAFTRTNAKAEYGNLLTLPVGGGLLYVQPLYVARDTGVGTYPVLRRVLVSLGDESGIGTTFEEAIDDVLGLKPGSKPPDSGTTNPDTGEPTAPVSQGVRALLQEASDFFAQADRALAEGDLAGYADFTSKAQDKLNEALALADKQAGQDG